MNEPTATSPSEGITPGPWMADRDDHREEYSIGVLTEQFGSREIATVSIGFNEPFESQQHANARLIAAAPDLLAACRAQHEAIDRLFARLIVLTREHTPGDVFFPSKSGQPWEATQLYLAALAKAGVKL